MLGKRVDESGENMEKVHHYCTYTQLIDWKTQSPQNTGFLITGKDSSILSKTFHVGNIKSFLTIHCFETARKYQESGKKLLEEFKSEKYQKRKQTAESEFVQESEQSEDDADSTSYHSEILINSDELDQEQMPSIVAVGEYHLYLFQKPNYLKILDWYLAGR